MTTDEAQNVRIVVQTPIRGSMTGAHGWRTPIGALRADVGSRGIVRIVGLDRSGERMGGSIVAEASTIDAFCREWLVARTVAGDISDPDPDAKAAQDEAEEAQRLDDIEAERDAAEQPE